jgi:hypothetical protein
VSLLLPLLAAAAAAAPAPTVAGTCGVQYGIWVEIQPRVRVALVTPRGHFVDPVHNTTALGDNPLTLAQIDRSGGLISDTCRKTRAPRKLDRSYLTSPAAIRRDTHFRCPNVTALVVVVQRIRSVSRLFVTRGGRTLAVASFGTKGGSYQYSVDDCSTWP